MRHRFIVLLTLLMSLVLAGCGGGGAGTSGSSVNATGLFITDNLNTGYDHVWVTIEKVTFDGTKGPFVAYDNPSGTVVDLKTLRDSSGAKFSLLGTMSLPSDTFSDVKVDLSDQLTLVLAGQTTGVQRTFAGAVAGVKELVFNFENPKPITSDFAIDFDLSQWIDNGTTVTAAIGEADCSGIGTGDRNVPDDHVGVVSGLAGTAPDQTFVFTAHEGFSFNVATSASTSIYMSDGTANPTLADGQNVLLHGVFDPSTHVFQAAAVMVLVGPIAEQHASGVPSNGDATAGTFTLAVSDAEGFVPTGVSVTVATTADTKFFNGSGVSLGQADFFAALATANFAQVNGTFDATSQTLTAKSIRLDGDLEDHDASVSGPASNIDASALTFDVSAVHFDGCYVASGAIVHVVTNTGTAFRGSDLSTMTSGDFFTALATAASVEVEGAFDASTGTITAAKAKINVPSTHPGVSVTGAPSAVDGTAFTFSLTVKDWEFGNLSEGALLSVTTDGTTAYRDSGGNVISQDAFFAALGSTPYVRVEGGLNGTTLAAKSARLLPPPTPSG